MCSIPDHLLGFLVELVKLNDINERESYQNINNKPGLKKWHLCSLDLELTTSCANSQTRFPQPRWLSWNAHQHLQDTTQTSFVPCLSERPLLCDATMQCIALQWLPLKPTRTNITTINMANTSRLQSTVDDHYLLVYQNSTQTPIIQSKTSLPKS